MKYDHYNSFADTIRSHGILLRLIHFLNSIFTAVGFLAYPALLVYLLCSGQYISLLGCVIIPGLAFLMVSVFRKYRNAPRPYEIYPIHPLIDKEKRGESFPSRHTFSIMLIGGLWFTISPGIGIMVLICGTGLAAIRIIGGVHFLKDVVWGAIMGIGMAFLSFYFIRFFS